ncbi:MAG: TIGR03663 family protein [Thermomicrobiales bacterium]|nr:MAG: TIGR03663 family protein [Thermomicrobiales bacterium]
MSNDRANGDLHETPVLVNATAAGEEVAEGHTSQPVPRRRRSATSTTAVTETDTVAVVSAPTVTSLPAFEKAGPTPRAMLPSSISWETVAYLLMIALAIGSRFWNLGEKALHHDESLHAYYSWVYYIGDGYRHDPLMHGPFLFHFGALIYLLFGDTDATARYGAAFFGVLMVGMPWFLRAPRFLGKYGALAASFFILISPSILYQSRYIRHDIYTIGGTLFLFICIFRYLDQPKRKWLILGSATLAFLFTNHEIVFAIVAIFYGFLYVALMIEQFTAFRRTGDRRAWELLGVHAGYLIGMVLLYALIPHATKNELLEIPWEDPTQAQENAYYKMFLTNPLIIGAAGLTIAFLVGLWWVLLKKRETKPVEADHGDDNALEAAPQQGRIYFTPADGFSVTETVRSMWADKTGLYLAIFAYLAVFVPLYTSMFTNMAGLRSSTIDTDGTLLYWLGQHDVRRGEQPWFYFLLLLPQYDYIVCVLGALLAAVTLVRSGASLLGWSGGRQLFFRLFLSIWFLAIFVGLSFGGEKMPWLVVHISLPGVLLAGAMVGALADLALRARARNVEDAAGAWNLLGLTLRDWALSVGLLLIGAAFVWIAAPLTYGQFVDVSDGGFNRLRRVVTETAADHWWWLAIPFLLSAVLIGAWVVWRGIQRTSFAVMAAVVIGLSLLQIHAGWRLSMHDGDVPQDMLIYTQTSPDVTRVMDELSALSEELTGGEGLEIWYDSGVSWPFQWYLRNYDNARFVGASLNQDPGNAPVLLLDGSSGMSSQFLSNYTATDYVLRWWFPEEIYRGFALAPELPPGRSAWESSDQPHGPFDILSSIFDTVQGEEQIDNQLRLYRLLMYRDLDWQIGSTGFQLYVRNDLIPLFNSIRYSQ